MYPVYPHREGGRIACLGFIVSGRSFEVKERNSFPARHLPPASRTVARQRGSPYGTVKSGFLYDTTIREFVNTRTGEITSAADAVPIPSGKRQRYRTGAINITYKATHRKDFPKRFHGDQVIDIIRRQLRRVPPDAIVVVRGQGGTEEYEDDWWSSVQTDVEDMLAMNDDELADYLYGLQEDGPEELELYFRQE